MRILYDSKCEEYKSPFGCLREQEECRLTVKVPKSCPVKKLFAVLEREDGLSLTVPLVSVSAEGEYEIFSCRFSLFARGLYFYYFRFETSISSFSLFRSGEHDTNMEEGEKWQLTCLPKDYSAPCSHMGRVMYQIFPDRFAAEGTCDLSEKLTPYTIHADKKEPPRKGADSDGNWNNDFYGGNLRGITAKLPYLASLGIGVIYLNPIFKAYSNHRYDTADYKKIDPMLGTEEDFRILCSEAGKWGISIILDGVFSHVGSNSLYFDEKGIFGGGAVSDPHSPYREWFSFRHYPDDYVCWWEVKSLPCVDELKESFLNYIIRDEDSVVAHWMRLGAAGFRLDVADELPDAFIALLRAWVKELNPEGLVIGEVWEDASNKCSYGERRKYFSGGELDGVMNYPFREQILRLVSGEITPQDFADAVNTLYENYPFEALSCSMTFLSTHDTPRVRTELNKAVGEAGVLPALKAAVALQYFLPGMPCIYYGDEVGMEGEGDPDNRGFFYEGKDAEELSRHYRMLGRLRQEREVLRRGKMQLSAVGNRLTVARILGEEKLTLTVVCEEGKHRVEISDGILECLE